VAELLDVLVDVLGEELVSLLEVKLEPMLGEELVS
jgi:hypothetical protein